MAGMTCLKALYAVQEAVERERQKAQAAAAAERAAFEAQEAQMAAELEQRTQQERRLLEQAAERARQAAEQRRRCMAALYATPGMPRWIMMHYCIQIMHCQTSSFVQPTGSQDVAQE